MAFSGFQDFDPNFSERLQLLMQERPGITINSGYRTPQRQAELFANAIQKYGSPEAARIHVAPAPGTYGTTYGSRHNHGLAADLAYASAEDRVYAHARAKELGLDFPLNNENWHIELAGTRSGEQPQLVAQNDQTGATVPISPELTRDDTRYPRTHDTPFTISGVSLNNAAAQQVGAIDRYAPTDWNSLATLMSPNRAASTELVKRIRSYA